VAGLCQNRLGAVEHAANITEKDKWKSVKAGKTEEEEGKKRRGERENEEQHTCMRSSIPVWGLDVSVAESNYDKMATLVRRDVKTM